MANIINNADFDAPADPFALFADWYALARESEPSDPDAMSLATIGAGGMPSVRIVLVKGHDARGFTFFTNRQSLKGEQLAEHPRAALCWHWKSLRRQIRAEGPVALVSEAESDAYHATRARGSQIGAWASRQSETLASRAELEQRLQKLEQEYAGKLVPRPPHWGGYRLMPLMIEFWQERPYRLHDRIVYRRDSDNGAWRIERLYP